MTLQHRLQEYASPEGAREYLEEYEKAHRKWSDRRERRILERFFVRTGKVGSALDLPCGFGRYLGFLREHAGQVAQSDWSGEMMLLSRRLFPEHPVFGQVRGSGSAMPFRDRAVDLVFSMRLNHHVADPAARRAHVDEILRVARRFAVFSYFDAGSLKARIRRWRARSGGKREKNTLARTEVRALAAAAGFVVHADPMLFAVGSGHRLLLAERAS
ncbi:MAG TPA: class I SAM-dependent methyltransferase [Planctomycetota bacterium]